MVRWLGVVSIFFVLSCATLREDPSVPAADAEFYSAEGVVNGDRFRGIKIVSLKKGEPLTNLSFEVQGIFSGSVKVDSRNCNVDETIHYEKSDLVKIPLSGSATKSCFFSFTVSPEYPNQKNQSVVIHGMKGGLAVRVLDDGQSWVGRGVQLSTVSNKFISLELRDETPVTVTLSGCGIEYSETLFPEEGWVSIPVDDFSLKVKGLCVASGVIISSEYEDLLLDVVVDRFDSGFIDLPKPSVSFKGDKVCVSADSSVSFLMTDSDYSNCTSKCFPKTEYIRGVTVKGRTFLGEIKDGVVEWK